MKLQAVMHAGSLAGVGAEETRIFTGASPRRLRPRLPASTRAFIKVRETIIHKNADETVQVGVWDIRERMKKQHIKTGDPDAKPTAQPVRD